MSSARQASDRWDQLIAMLQTDDSPPQLGANMTELNGNRPFEVLVSQALDLAKKVNAPVALLDLLGKIEDECNTHGVRASYNAYNVGYGDGWHAGALAVLRLVAGGSGIPVPAASPALAMILGLDAPGGTKRKGPTRGTGDLRP